jgi:RHS repeat-associated protein
MWGGFQRDWQVISGKKYWSDGTPVAGQQFEYAFDDIGNRTGTKAGGDENGAGLRSAAYSANDLNQYTSRDVPGFLDIIGLAFATNAVTVNGQAPYRKGEYFRKELSVNNASAPGWTNITVNATGQASVSGNALLPKTPETFAFDGDGNLVQDGLWSYTWDTENRLVSMQSVSSVPSAAKLKLDFAYDHLSRRTQKVVSTWNGSAYLPQYTNRFVYDGWNLAVTLASDLSPLASFTWGLDLSGSLHGVGGVGGLLWMTIPSGSNAGTYFYTYDGNGNVAALVAAADGTRSAVYEYGPFGELLRATGPMAKANPFRFSTKCQDNETDLVYYGFRYEKDARWISRDPIEEPGFDWLQGGNYGGAAGPNLYNFVANNPVSGIDLFGLKLGDVPGEHPFPPYPPNPSMIGKKCCGMSHCPAHLTGTRTDTAPTTSGGIFGIYTPWTLHLGVHINADSDCYTDVRVDWMRCWGTGGAGYMGSGTSLDLSVSTVLGIGNVWLTEARINYLTCENGVWAKKLSKAGMSYRWTGTGWEFTVSGGGPTTTTPGS